MSLIVWVYLHSNLCSGLQKTHLCCNSVGRKRILTSNSHSRSSKVIHFAISYQPTRGSMSPYNTAGLISEDSEEVATQIAKNCRRRQPHPLLTPPPRGTPTNIPINLIFPETRIVGLGTFLSLIVWVYLHSHLSSGLQKTHLLCDRVRFGRSRSFRVIQGR